MASMQVSYRLHVKSMTENMHQNSKATCFFEALLFSENETKQCIACGFADPNLAGSELFYRVGIPINSSEPDPSLANKKVKESHEDCI